MTDGLVTRHIWFNSHELIIWGYMKVLKLNALVLVRDSLIATKYASEFSVEIVVFVGLLLMLIVLLVFLRLFGSS